MQRINVQQRVNVQRQIASMAVALALCIAGAHAAIAQPQQAPQQADAPTIYYVLMHSPGKHWVAGKGFREQPGVMDHVAYVSQFEEMGMLIIGGPFLDDSGGMMVLKVATLAEAQRIANDDPTVKSGLLKVTVKPWLIVMSALKTQ